MNRNSLILLPLVAIACLACTFATAAPQVGDPSIENTLAAQRAIVQARDHLVKGESKKAVDVLEANLSRTNGDRKYLSLLRDAYRGYIQDASLANQPSVVEVYQKRLKILDDYEGTSSPVQALPTAQTGAIVSTVPPAFSLPALKSDPFVAANELKLAVGGALSSSQHASQAKELLAKAYEEFKQKRFATAKHLYEQANYADKQIMGDESRARWAYCQLSLVVDQLNRFPGQACDWVQLEADAKNAAAVAPSLAATANDILSSIDKRRSAVPGTVRSAMPTVTVKHLPKRGDGWVVAETANFRVFHNQSQDYAAKVAEIAEVTRFKMARKWFGKEGEDWSPKCDIYLFATAAEYSQKTDQHASSPGHSKIDLDPKAGRVVARQINLRCDNPSMLESILPHETTHVVLAGQFGKHHVPRWADEGIAVLTEPNDKVQQHRGNLAKSLRNQELIPLRDLLQMDNYPPAARISTFYAQSVALVDFLSQQKGPVVLTQFIRDGLQEGYESALRKHYSYQDIADLQSRFTEHVLAETNSPQSGYSPR